MATEMTEAGPMYRVYGAGAGRSTSVLLERNMAARVMIVVWHVESKGGILHLTEGHRPIGSPSDQYVTDERKTSTGGSNQWYQVGRMNRGLTPSAIVPPTKSRHWSGRALDSNAPTSRDMTLRAEGYYLAGLVRNVPSESWHAEPLDAPRVDLAPWLAKLDDAPSTPSKPTTPAAPAAPKSHLIKEHPMWLAQTVDTKRIYLITSLGAKWLGAMSTVTLFQRLIKYHGGNDTPIRLYQSEVDVIAAEAKAAGGSTDTKALAKAIADNIRPDVAKALKDIDVQAGASADEIADEIARRLAA